MVNLYGWHLNLFFNALQLPNDMPANEGKVISGLSQMDTGQLIFLLRRLI
jgi:hypothetical protein